MSSLRLLLALNFLGWSLLVFIGFSTLVAPAVALPVAYPMVHSADFASASNTSTPVFSQHVSPGTPTGKRDVLDSVEGLGAVGNALPASSPVRRDINTVLGDINILNNYYSQMSQHTDNFRASRSYVMRSLY